MIILWYSGSAHDVPWDLCLDHNFCAPPPNKKPFSVISFNEPYIQIDFFLPHTRYQMKIINVQANDYGDYICEGVNKLGTGQAIVNLFGKFTVYG